MGLVVGSFYTRDMQENKSLGKLDMFDFGKQDNKARSFIGSCTGLVVYLQGARQQDFIVGAPEIKSWAQVWGPAVLPTPFAGLIAGSF